MNGDFVSVYDGVNMSSAILVGKTSGNKRPPEMVAYSGVMWVQFTSNDRIQKAGFTAQFWTCNYHIEFSHKKSQLYQQLQQKRIL